MVFILYLSLFVLVQFIGEFNDLLLEFIIERIELSVFIYQQFNVLHLVSSFPLLEIYIALKLDSFLVEADAFLFRMFVCGFPTQKDFLEVVGVV